jgi:octaprenyl-diphosphate synthase
MTQAAAVSSTSAPSLDALYALIRDDLKRVDALILERVKSDVALIEHIARHIIASGGKRIRPALTLIASKLCGYEGTRHVALAAAVEFIHTATLLHDDVVDESVLRRGLDTANVVFGNKASVLVGDYLLSQAFQMMVADGNPKVLRILSDASAVIARGEVMQLMTEGDLDTSLERYLEVISSKTAVLFAAASELGAVVTGQEKSESALREFGLNIGIAFQLVDDALDYAADQEKLGKTVGDDFREGKITLPVIIAANAGSAEEKSFWRRVMTDKEQAPDDLARATSLLAKHNATAQTVAMARNYCQKARASLAGFEPSAARDAMLDLVDFCASRAY